MRWNQTRRRQPFAHRRHQFPTSTGRFVSYVPFPHPQCIRLWMRCDQSGRRCRLKLTIKSMFKLKKRRWLLKCVKIAVQRKTLKIATLTDRHEVRRREARSFLVFIVCGGGTPNRSDSRLEICFVWEFLWNSGSVSSYVNLIDSRVEEESFPQYAAFPVLLPREMSLFAPSVNDPKCQKGRTPYIEASG